MLLPAALVFAVTALAAVGWAFLQVRHSRRALLAAHEKLARIDAALPPHEEGGAVGAEALRRDVRVVFEAKAVEHDRTLLAALLADFRDVTGAEEAIFWRWKPEREALAPAVWSSDGPRPAHFNLAEWGPLVQWSAETGVVQTVGHDDATYVGAACVKVDDRLLGVLSLTHSHGLGLGRPALKEWVPRLAHQLATFHELLGVR